MADEDENLDDPSFSSAALPPPTADVCRNINNKQSQGLKAKLANNEILINNS